MIMYLTEKKNKWSHYNPATLSKRSGEDIKKYVFSVFSAHPRIKLLYSMDILLAKQFSER